jgi:hypothetical protein
VTKTVAGRQDSDQAVTGLVLAVLENPLKPGCGEQAAAAWIARRHNQPEKRRSDGQASAPFGPTRLDDETAALGAHPGTKTVGALALQVAGLKSSLHGAIRSQIVEGPLLGGPNQAAQITGFGRVLSTALLPAVRRFSCG